MESESSKSSESSESSEQARTSAMQASKAVPCATILMRVCYTPKGTARFSAAENRARWNRTLQSRHVSWRAANALAEFMNRHFQRPEYATPEGARKAERIITRIDQGQTAQDRLAGMQRHYHRNVRRSLPPRLRSLGDSVLGSET